MGLEQCAHQSFKSNKTHSHSHSINQTEGIVADCQCQPIKRYYFQNVAIFDKNRSKLCCARVKVIILFNRKLQQRCDNCL